MGLHASRENLKSRALSIIGSSQHASSHQRLRSYTLDLQAELVTDKPELSVPPCQEFLRMAEPGPSQAFMRAKLLAFPELGHQPK